MGEVGARAPGPRSQERRQQRPQRLAAVADLELAAGAGLAESTPKGRIEEEGIVAEAALAARGLENQALHFAGKHSRHAAAFQQRDAADEPGGEREGAAREAAQFLEQQAV